MPGTRVLSADDNSTGSIFVKYSFGPRISITSSSHLSGGPPLVSIHFTGDFCDFMTNPLCSRVSGIHAERSQLMFSI